MGRLLTKRFEQQGGRCGYCRRPCKLRGPVYDEMKATLDHVIPRSGGGPECAWNKVMACRGCNEAKGASHEAHFLKVLEANGYLPPGSKSKMRGRALRAARCERLAIFDALPAGSRKDRLPAAGWHIDALMVGVLSDGEIG